MATSTRCAQVAINDGDQDEAERLSMVALENCRWPTITTASSPHRCMAKFSIVRKADQILAVMQQTEQMARRHDVWHYALWSIIQQSEILFAQGFLQAAWESQEKAFQLVREQHLEQLPMHEFLLRIRSQLLWAWARLDEAEACARQGWTCYPPISPSSSCSAWR